MASLLAGIAACSSASSRVGEGVSCSTSTDDNPYSECLPNAQLACATTYSVNVTTGGTHPVYVCRYTCTTQSDCTHYTDDVCCPGQGVNGAAANVCTPLKYCAALGGDGGVPDAGGAGTDVPLATADAGADDAPAALDGAAPDAGATDALGDAGL